MRVTKIIDPEFKSGTSEKGRKWVLSKVEVEGGKTATGFNPVKIGDEVELNYNAQYKSYSFKVVEPGDIPFGGEAPGFTGSEEYDSQPLADEQLTAFLDRTGQPDSPSPDVAVPEYEAGTNARWALKLSVDTYKSVVGGMPDTEQDFTKILNFAKWLLASFDEIKGMKKGKA